MAHVIRDVMYDVNVRVQDIDRRYQKQTVYGAANFACTWRSCRRKWKSRIAWATINLRSQCIKQKWQQACEMCKTPAIPSWSSETIAEMVQAALIRHDRQLEGKTVRPLRLEGRTPHSELLCERCDFLGHPCWNTSSHEGIHSPGYGGLDLHNLDDVSFFSLYVEDMCDSDDSLMHLEFSTSPDDSSDESSREVDYKHMVILDKDELYESEDENDVCKSNGKNCIYEKQGENLNKDKGENKLVECEHTYGLDTSKDFSDCAENREKIQLCELNNDAYLDKSGDVINLHADKAKKEPDTNVDDEDELGLYENQKRIKFCKNVNKMFVAKCENQNEVLGNEEEQDLTTNKDTLKDDLEENKDTLKEDLEENKDTLKGDLEDNKEKLKLDIYQDQIIQDKSKDGEDVDEHKEPNHPNEIEDEGDQHETKGKMLKLLPTSRKISFKEEKILIFYFRGKHYFAKKKDKSQTII